MPDDIKNTECGHSIEYTVISSHAIPEDPSKPHIVLLGIPAGAYMALLNGSAMPIDYDEDGLTIRIVLVAKPTHAATEELMDEIMERNGIPVDKSGYKGTAH